MIAHRDVEQLNALTSLRFFAAAFVVAFHYSDIYFDNSPRTGIVSIGYCGVTFFFLLSGFILSYNYRETDFSRRENVLKYLIARFARIYPVYILSLIISVPFLIASSTEIAQLPVRIVYLSSIILSLLGLQAWVPGAACAVNCPSWSISTEFFFYLMFPLLFPLIYRSPRRWFGVTIAAWAAVTTMLLVVWAELGQGQSIIDVTLAGHPTADLASQFVKFFPVNRLTEFMLGVVLFVVWERHRDSLRRIPMVGLFAIASAFLLLIKAHVSQILLHDGLTAIAWAPLIVAGAGMRQGLLASRPMVFLGRISFSLYLLHVPVWSAMTAFDKHVLGNRLLSAPSLFIVLTAIAALGVSILLFRFVEEPMRHFIMHRSPGLPLAARANKKAPTDIRLVRRSGSLWW
jgi:peptidoglycan/LPS O-acetylase OafA/YrhL